MAPARAVLGLFLLGQIAVADDAIAIKPNADKLTLTIGQRTMKPIKVTSPFREEHAAGRLAIEVAKNELIARDPETDEVKWRASVEQKSRLQWLAASESVVFLRQLVPEAQEEDRWEPETTGLVRRVQQSDGKWLEALDVKKNKADPPVETPTIVAVLPRDKGAVILSVDSAGKPLYEQQINSYRVTCFDQDGKRRAWMRDFPSAGPVQELGVALLAARMPSYARTAIASLSVLDAERLLVCAGPSQDILALDRRSGEIIWKLEKIWEFERGFIGPSVWRHFVGRFGLQEHEEKIDAQKRKNAAETSRIIGGPIVVPFGKEKRIFVAVSKRENFGGYSSDCVAYEVAEDGKPIALVNMPRNVIGSDFIVADGGVVWRCDKDAIVRLVPSEREFMGMGPGGSDCIATLEWYRTAQKDAPDPKPWLISDPTDAFALGEKHIFRLSSGPYVQNQHDQVLWLPASRAEAQTGKTLRMTSRLPYEGKFPAPERNYSGVDGRFEVTGTYLLGITRLEVRNNRLLVTVASDFKWSATFHFDLQDIDRAAGD